MFNPKEKRGQILVLAALSPSVIKGFAVLAIDIGYYCHTKNRLQGAADAAALPDETTARAEAVKYALMNIAAGAAVQVSNDGINFLSSSLTPAMT